MSRMIAKMNEQFNIYEDLRNDKMKEVVSTFIWAISHLRNCHRNVNECGAEHEQAGR